VGARSDGAEHRAQMMLSIEKVRARRNHAFSAEHTVGNRSGADRASKTSFGSVFSHVENGPTCRAPMPRFSRGARDDASVRAATGSPMTD
jgi:hypothetical protein